MKKFLAFVLGGMLLCMPVFASPSQGGSISATATSQNISVGKRHLILINDGANEVFVTLNDSPALTTDFELRSGESIVYDSDDNIVSFSVVCSSSETATVRFESWI